METVKRKNRVCPVESAGHLDTSLRRLFQNPRRILKQYIRPGMTILDLGCGPGFFTTAMADMLNGSGKVIAADLQRGMLDKLRARIAGTPLEQKIELHLCHPDMIGVTSHVDFILAFYVVHEIEDHLKLFSELRSIINKGGILFIAEPGFHVSRKEFATMVVTLENCGFKIISRQGILISRSAVAIAV